MSTNAAYGPQGAGRHYTVAELVARERAAAVRARATQRIHQPMSDPTRRIAPVGTQAGGPDQQGMHVTELLRREGVGYGDDGASAQAAPPALAAKPPKDRSRAGMLSRAAVLVGLTVGGMVGLQSTVANAPDSSPGPVDSGGAVAAPQQIEPRSSISAAGAENEQEQEPRGGGASPTTSADVELRDHASELPTQAAQAPAGGADSASTAADDTADTAAPAPTTTQAPAPAPASPNAQQESSASQPDEQDRSSTQQDTQQQDSQQQDAQQQPESSQQEPSQTEEPDSDDNDDGGGLLDPVTGVVSGVLDGGLLG